MLVSETKEEDLLSEIVESDNIRGVFCNTAVAVLLLLLPLPMSLTYCSKLPPHSDLKTKFARPVARK